MSTKNPKKEAKNNSIIMAMFVVLFIGGIPLLTRHTNNIFREYPKFLSTDQININISAFDRFKGTTLLVDSNNNKRSIRAFHSTNGDMLYEFLETNDSIAKVQDTNKLRLYKSDGRVIEFDLLFLEE